MKAVLAGLMGALLLAGCGASVPVGAVMPTQSRASAIAAQSVASKIDSARQLIQDHLGQLLKGSPHITKLHISPTLALVVVKFSATVVYADHAVDIAGSVNLLTHHVSFSNVSGGKLDGVPVAPAPAGAPAEAPVGTPTQTPDPSSTPEAGAAAL